MPRNAPEPLPIHLSLQKSSRPSIRPAVPGGLCLLGPSDPRALERDRRGRRAELRGIHCETPKALPQLGDAERIDSWDGSAARHRRHRRRQAASAPTTRRPAAPPLGGRSTRGGGGKMVKRRSFGGTLSEASEAFQSSDIRSNPRRTWPPVLGLRVGLLDLRAPRSTRVAVRRSRSVG